MFIHLFNIRYILESKYNNIIYVHRTQHQNCIGQSNALATSDTGWAKPTAYIVGIRFRLEWEFGNKPSKYHL